MSLTVQIPLPSRTLAILKAAPTWPRQLLPNIATAIDKENELTVSHIQASRMSRRGPDTLGVVTNRARSSVRPEMATVSSAGVVLSSIGSNVRYFGPHEIGFVGTVTVKEHTRKNPQNNVYSVRGKTVRGWELAGAGGGRATLLAGGVSRVRAHSMAMNIPARAPIRRGIEDRAVQYRERLALAVTTTFELPQS